MRRLTTTIAALTAITLGAAGVATADSDKPKPNNVAAKQCQAEKQADRAAFQQTYGPKHAMRNCKRAHRDDAEDSIATASQECRAERDADPVAFQETYGSNGNGKNAFGKCVSARVREDTAEGASEFSNAARECRAERSADPDGFAATYGTNENRRNAFGKCVSQKVRADEATSAA
jgi:hypothetical protein